jgi:hypothetical protein
MIGTSSFLLETGAVLGVLIIAVALWRVLRGIHRLVWILPGAMLTLMGIRYAVQCAMDRKLRSLPTAGLAQVQVGEVTLTAPEHLQAIAAALGRSQWFSSNHGGWGHMVPLRLRTRDGAEVLLRAAYYPRQPGVILYLGEQGHGLSFGYRFSAHLQEALRQAGAALPGEEWVQVHKGEWSAWYDRRTRAAAPPAVQAWVRVEQGRRSLITRARYNCQAATAFYGRREGADWTGKEFAVRQGSVSESLLKALCQER